MDQKRPNIGQFYSPEAILVYEGHRHRGQGTIADFYQKIPPSSHRVTSLDAQPMDKAMTDGNKAILISGNIRRTFPLSIFRVDYDCISFDIGLSKRRFCWLIQR